MRTAKQLSKASRKVIDHWLQKFPPEQKRSAVLAALTQVQGENGGHLTRDLMDLVAAYLDMPAIQVYEVGSFYSMFDLHPTGRHKVSVCDNISCMLCGAEEILAHIESKLGIKKGETTADGRISLIPEEECLAACCGAPMMVVDGHYHEHLTADKVDKILDTLE